MNKDISKWNKVFLDSTILVDLLSNPSEKKPEEVNKRIRLTETLIKSLTEIEPESGKREFIISAISIAEIFAINEADEENIYEAIQIHLGSDNFRIISFNRDVSMFHNNVFRQKLNNLEIKNLQKEIDYPTSNYVSIAERIRKDYLIIATALYDNPDIIFTGDRKEFLALARSVGLNCHDTNSEDNFLMSQGGDKIYGVK